MFTISFCAIYKQNILGTISGEMIYFSRIEVGCSLKVICKEAINNNSNLFLWVILNIIKNNKFRYYIKICTKYHFLQDWELIYIIDLLKNFELYF